ncbi:hypothetical protein [Saccharopolyspora gloriosae]|uniref:hypothetical protein n=1 Tax=Saccharopolyspora gloriosae TaxID=455344 RepID=UPI001FB5D39E|nr:hypothetical protein [Saccharopolyspora gloriosae]
MGYSFTNAATGTGDRKRAGEVRHDSVRRAKSAEQPASCGDGAHYVVMFPFSAPDADTSGAESADERADGDPPAGELVRVMAERAVAEGSRPMILT